MARPIAAVPYNFTSEGLGTANNIPLLDADFTYLVNQFNDAANGYPSLAYDTGTVNNYVVTLASTPSGYVSGMQISVFIANTNTGPSVINVNSLGTKSIVSGFRTPLVGGELLVNEVVTLIYDGTYFAMSSIGGYYPRLMYANDTGTANAYAVQVPYIYYSVANYLLPGFYLFFNPANNNTGASTLSLNGTSGIPLVTKAGVGLQGFEIITGRTVGVVFDGTNFRIITPLIRNYGATDPGNPFIECAGYDGVFVFVHLNSVGLGITLTHLGLGVPVMIKIYSQISLPYWVQATDETGAGLNTYWHPSTSPSGGTPIRMDSSSSQTIGATASVFLTGARDEVGELCFH
jgi:hypothetical protein